jgi:hypothetical protein
MPAKISVLPETHPNERPEALEGAKDLLPAAVELAAPLSEEAAVPTAWLKA